MLSLNHTIRHFVKEVGGIAALVVASVVVLLSAPSAVLAEPYFIHKDGAMVLDKATGLVWMRCSLGQTWDGKTCTGVANKYTFEQAQQAAKDLNTNGGFGESKDWVVPTVRQLYSLIFCSTGQFLRSVDPNDGGARIANYCTGIKPTIHTEAFLGSSDGFYWVSSPYVGNSAYAWSVDFVNGDVGYGLRSNGNGAVRLVRSSQLLDEEANLGFVNRLASAADIQAATKRKAQSDKASAISSLVAKGAQNLYVEAGKAQRNGSVTVNNTNFSARDLYELLIEKFPKSDFAVKATDQLNAMERSDRQAAAAREGQERNRQQQDAQRSSNRQACEAQKRTCESQCPPPGRGWTGDDGPRNRCMFFCDRISCN